MSLRNRLKDGYYGVFLPIGLPITIKYKSTGNLDSITTYFEDLSEGVDFENLPSKLVNLIQRKNKIPSHVETNKGKVTVYAVLYTGITSNLIGSYDGNEFRDKMIEDALVHDFNIFSAFVFGDNLSFSSWSGIQGWLKRNQFKVLDAMIIPHGTAQEERIRNFIDGQTPFNYDYLYGCILVDSEQPELYNFDKYIDQVESIDVYLDEYGFVHAHLDLKNSNPLNISYYEMIKLQIHSGDYVLFECNNDVFHPICKFPKSIKDPKKPNFSYSCPFCGNIFLVESDDTCCTNPHCMSHQYPNIVHFSTKLGIKPITYKQYVKYVQSNKLTKFSNILDVKPYCDTEIITSLGNLFDAIIPMKYVRNRDSIYELCNSCNNSVESFYYYLDHPDLIQQLLMQENKGNLVQQVSQIVDWLTDTENAKNVKDILQYTNIVFENSDRKFDGEPILRDKKIWLTGKFNHGSYAEIGSILRSYSADIVESEKCNCCIIGDIAEGVNGSTVNKLRDKGILTISESEFFGMYQIDSDLH